MATRTRIFGFIRSKTMAYFRRGTWKLRENIRCVVGGEVLDIKTLKSTAKEVSQDYDECRAYLKVMHGLRLHLFFFYFSRCRIADVFSQLKLSINYNHLRSAANMRFVMCA